jgi:hypothetical protein
MCRLVYPFAKQAAKTGQLSQAALSASIASTAEGYSFPTNLDRDPPIGGLAPETQAAFLARAIAEDMDQERFEAGLDKIAAAKSA